MFHVVCDGCGADAQAGSDHVAWAERDTARIEPDVNGWWTDGADLDLCPACDVCGNGWWTDGADRDLCPTCWDKSGEALTREVTAS